MTTKQFDVAPTEPQTLAEALLAFQANMPRVGKDKTALIPTKGGGSYAYKYADLGTIQDAVLPLLTQVGLTFTTKPRREEDGTFVLVGVLRHTSGESDEGSLPIFVRGTGQEMGSSITYARRYLLTAMTGIVTEEDDDGASASQGHNRATQEQADEDRRQAMRNVAEDRAGQRYRRALAGAATREGFVSEVEGAFAQPYDNVTAEQFDVFYPEGGGVRDHEQVTS